MFFFLPQFSPALSRRTPSLLSSSAVWNTPPCARGMDAGHRSPSSRGGRSLHPAMGSINTHVMVSTEHPNKEAQVNVMCVIEEYTCHAMRSLRRSSLSLSSGCCWLYSSVKNAWHRGHIKNPLKEQWLCVSPSPVCKLIAGFSTNVCTF